MKKTDILVKSAYNSSGSTHTLTTKLIAKDSGGEKRQEIKKTDCQYTKANEVCSEKNTK